MSGDAGPDLYQAIAALYDHVPVYRDRPDVPFFMEAAKDAGGPVLEVGCGSGRVLIPCARAGARIVGLDASAPMLARCRDRLRQETAAVQAAVRLVQGDMRDFALPETFALAMFPFRSFQHMVTVNDQIAALDCVRRHLEARGRVIVDVFNPSIDALASRREGEEFGEEPEFTMPDGQRVVRRHKVVKHDRHDQINHVELLYDVTHPDGRQERLVQAFAMRYLFRFELEHLLARCGFDVEAVYSGYDRAPYGTRYPGELIAVARRRG
jgi:SAM-dependent methyltransferase